LVHNPATSASAKARSRTGNRARAWGLTVLFGQKAHDARAAAIAKAAKAPHKNSGEEYQRVLLAGSIMGFAAQPSGAR
jgi:hypothetical protein